MSDVGDRRNVPDWRPAARDDAIRDSGEPASEALASQRRLRELLRANRLVIEEIDLTVVLRRIVEAAAELVDARYGAVGVLAPDGTLEQFLHVGVDESTAERIGDLPRGRGVLGALLNTTVPMRVPRVSEDPRSVGFPPAHPAMGAFLGVPIRVRQEVYGNLYLTRDSDRAFTEEDEELVASLAATAGAAIDHARLLAESRKRQEWAIALADVTTALLSADAIDGMSVIVDRVAPLVQADFACVLIPDDEGHALRIENAKGVVEGLGRTTIDPALGSIAARALESGYVTSGDVREEPEGVWPDALRWSAAVPFIAGGAPMGVLFVARSDERSRFDGTDLDLAAGFAAQAGVALELARARQDRQTLQRVEERSRIARDLHDHVIQRLFAAGLSLQAMEPMMPAPLRDDFGEQIDAIDNAIVEIRTAIFTLTQHRNRERATLRTKVLDVVSEVGRTLAGPPVVTFAGPVDVFVPDALAEDVVAVVRESLTNVAKHAEASRTEIRVSLEDGHLTVRVDDDGRGLAGATRSSGTSNLASRAAGRGGHFSLDARGGGGASMIWRVPIELDEVAS